MGNEKKAAPPIHRNAEQKNAASGLRSGSQNRRPKAASAVSAASAEEVRPGDTIVVTVNRIGINGEGVGYYKRKAVFVGGALPDEVVKATVTKAEPGYLTAYIQQIEKKSPHRIQSPCPVYESCGGCQPSPRAFFQLNP